MNKVQSIFSAFLMVSSFAAYANESRVIETLASAVMESKNGVSMLHAEWPSGGCGPDTNGPFGELKLVSKTLVNRGSRSENTIPEYRLVMKVIIKEKTSTPCRMGYDLKLSLNLSELFRQAAPALGIDLSARKAHFIVSFVAPEVRGYDSISAFD